MSAATRTEFLIALAALAYGVGVGVLNIIGSAYGTGEWIMLAVMYGWLGFFIFLAWVRRSNSRTLFIIGSIPMALIALLLTVFSWPIFLPSVLLMLVAITRIPSVRPSSST